MGLPGPFGQSEVWGGPLHSDCENDARPHVCTEKLVGGCLEFSRSLTMGYGSLLWVFRNVHAHIGYMGSEGSVAVKTTLGRDGRGGGGTLRGRGRKDLWLWLESAGTSGSLLNGVAH